MFALVPDLVECGRYRARFCNGRAITRDGQRWIQNFTAKVNPSPALVRRLLLLKDKTAVEFVTRQLSPLRCPPLLYAVH